jgi:hypothetical protein
MVRDHRIETFTFQAGSTIGENFNAYSWRSVNGILMSVWIGSSNYNPTGSLFLTVSGEGYPLWSMISGTVTGDVAQSGAYHPRAYPVNQVNTNLSGTNAVIEDIPIFGTLRLCGSGVGAGSSCAEITVVYRMG